MTARHSSCGTARSRARSSSSPTAPIRTDMRLPTVVVAEAIHGLAVRHGEHVWVSDNDEESLVAATRRLLSERDLANRLGRNGRLYVVDHHDWRKLATKLESALVSLARANSSPTRLEPARRRD